MWEFRHLKLPTLTPASNRKSVVSSAVPKLSTADRLILLLVVIWCCTMLYWLLTAERPIDESEYRDNISIEINNIA